MGFETKSIVIQENCDLVSIKTSMHFVIYRLTCRSKDVLFAKNAKCTRLTKWRSTKKVRKDMPRRAEGVTIVNSKVLVVKQSPSSERRYENARTYCLMYNTNFFFFMIRLKNTTIVCYWYKTLHGCYFNEILQYCVLILIQFVIHNIGNRYVFNVTSKHNSHFRNLSNVLWF